MKYSLMICALLCGLVGASANTDESAPFRLASNSDERRYRSMLPETNDVWLSNIFARKDLIWYTDKEMPRAYQYNSGLHSPEFNLSANRSEPYGNPNVEFPWGAPAGTHRSVNAHAFRFVYLPGPVVWWKQKAIRGGRVDSEVFGWEFPFETTFCEILMLNDSQNKLWTYEVRTRTKGEHRWFANVFRPFASREELEAWLEDNAPNVNLGSPRSRSARLLSVHPQLTTFDRTAVIDELPSMPDDVVAKALQRPFKSVMGSVWTRRNDVPGYAPTTKATFSIVPIDYDAGFIELTSRSCMSCHDDTLKEASEFDRVRDWRGRVRGSDKILSFHIFEPDSISDNGSAKEPKLRRSMIDAGLLRHWQSIGRW